MVGREYGYVSVTHLDFPLNDSPTKIIGDSTTIQINVTTTYECMGDVGTLPWWPNTSYHNTPTAEEIIRAAEILKAYRTQKFTSVSLRPFDLTRLHTPVDVGNQLCNHFNSIRSQQSPGSKDYDAYLWQNWFQQIAYDGSTGKLQCLFTVPDRVIHIASPYSAEGLTEEMALIAVHNAGPGHFAEHPLTEANYPFQLQRIEIEIGGTDQVYAGQLMAAMLGGKVVSPYLGWKSTFDTGLTDWFKIVQHGIETGSTSNSYILSQSAQLYPVYGQRPLRMFIDPYVYIRGAPESSITGADGKSTDILSIQPRNRLPGSITSMQAFLGGQTHSIKTSLASLRSMALTFTASDGRFLQIDEEFIVKLAIDFQR